MRRQVFRVATIQKTKSGKIDSMYELRKTSVYIMDGWKLKCLLPVDRTKL